MRRRTRRSRWTRPFAPPDRPNFSIGKRTVCIFAAGGFGDANVTHTITEFQHDGNGLVTSFSVDGLPLTTLVPDNPKEYDAGIQHAPFQAFFLGSVMMPGDPANASASAEGGRSAGGGTHSGTATYSYILRIDFASSLPGRQFTDVTASGEDVHYDAVEVPAIAPAAFDANDEPTVVFTLSDPNVGFLELCLTHTDDEGNVVGLATQNAAGEDVVVPWKDICGRAHPDH
ncbi:hypothetical protein [Demequina maris]|uniref:hypothetical protein n=1 Tax=Demequina maris TaxID=1638982 RepID=UPI0007847556|nr:hypothetical protein [Demequina maris]